MGYTSEERIFHDDGEGSPTLTTMSWPRETPVQIRLNSFSIAKIEVAKENMSLI